MIGIVHVLKLDHDFYLPIRSGQKTFEVRLNDRDYAVDDILVLRDFHPHAKSYSSVRPEIRVVTYITNFPPAIREGWVCMAVRAPTADELVYVVAILCERLEQSCTDSG